MPSGVYQSPNRRGGQKGSSGVYLKSKEHRQKISQTLKLKGIKPPTTFGKKHWLGKHHSEETKRKISLGMMGKHSGENHPLWIKDRTKLKKQDKRNDPLYIEWRKNVLKSDYYRCRISNINCSGNMEVHHILGWKRYIELRYEVNNGITLCHFHHPRKRNDEVRLIPFFQKMVNIKVN